MRLCDIKDGTVTITSVDCEQGIRHRLQSMGIITGQDITILRNAFGPIIIRVIGSKIALGKELASCIRVKA